MNKRPQFVEGVSMHISINMKGKEIKDRLNFQHLTVHLGLLNHRAAIAQNTKAPKKPAYLLTYLHTYGLHTYILTSCCIFPLLLLLILYLLIAKRVQEFNVRTEHHKSKKVTNRGPFS